MIDNELTKILDDPAAIEALYRHDKVQFSSWLSDALAQFPQSETLKVWNARLHYAKPSRAKVAKRPLFIVILLSFVAGFLVKLPVFFPIDSHWFTPRFIPLIIFTALIAYFLRDIAALRLKRTLVFALFLVSLIMLIFPYEPKSASLTMSFIHLPLLLASLLGLAFMSTEWKETAQRLLYIRYLGEITIYTAIILIGGMVLTLLTLGLFDLIGLDIGKWYMENVVVFGLVAAPIVATFLYDVILGRESKLATIIANIFAPLFLFTVVIYLIAIVYQGKSPYSNRDFLILFNGLLILVLAITVFSIAGKNKESSKLIDTVNVSLVTVTLFINAIALSAIVFRLSTYGITPNRIAVTGANALIFMHLVLILKSYVKQLKGHCSTEQLNDVIAKYLPIYSSWSLFIVAILPLLFWFA